MDWKSMLPKGVELSLTWRGALRYMDQPEEQRQATWHVIARVQDPLRFALSGKGDLAGWFSVEPNMQAFPTTGRVEWFLQGKREVFHEATFQDPDGVQWKLIGVRPLALRTVADGFGHLHCQLLRDEKIVAVGVLSSGIQEVGDVLRSVRAVRDNQSGELEPLSDIEPDVGPTQRPLE